MYYKMKFKSLEEFIKINNKNDIKFINDVIDLSNMNITELPENLTIKCYMLYLSNNKLKTIPSSCKFECHNIDLSENNFTVVPNLRNSKCSIIELQRNKIKSIPNDKNFFIICDKIDLSHNNIEILTEDWNKLDPYDLIDFSNNKIKEISPKYYSVSRCEINLSYNKLRKLPEKTKIKSSKLKLYGNDIENIPSAWFLKFDIFKQQTYNEKEKINTLIF